MAVSDLSKAHGAAAGRAKALEEVRAQHQAEKRKAEQQAARFAKRQAARLEYESCLANSPYRTARSAGEASRGGSGDTSASSRPPQQFREGMNCPECLTGVLSMPQEGRVISSSSSSNAHQLEGKVLHGTGIFTCVYHEFIK